MPTNSLPRNICDTDLAGYRTVSPPPKGFDLLRASPEELLAYHLPHRPDPRVSKNAVRAWRRAMGSVHSFVKPELVLRPNSRRSFPRLPAEKFGPDNNFNWAGTVVQPQQGGFEEIWGCWNVPNIVATRPVLQPPIDAAPNYSIAIWVGLDGGPNSLSTDLCQAGITMDLTVDNKGNTIASDAYGWTFWDVSTNQANLTATINNFSFSPGDTIAVQLQFLGVISGQITASAVFANLTQGVALSPIVFTAPQSVNFIGDSAEWIVEVPTFFVNGAATQGNLPAFGNVLFFDASAVSAVGGKGPETTTIVDAAAGTPLNMLSTNGDSILASEDIVSALEVSFAWAGPQEQPSLSNP